MLSCEWRYSTDCTSDPPFTRLTRYRWWVQAEWGRFGEEKGEYWGPTDVQGVVLWLGWPDEHPDAPSCTSGGRGGRNTPGGVSFIITTQEKLETVWSLLALVWLCFQTVLFEPNSCQDLHQLLRCVLGCSDYLSQRSTASSVFQHNLYGPIFG